MRKSLIYGGFPAGFSVSGGRSVFCFNSFRAIDPPLTPPLTTTFGCFVVATATAVLPALLFFPALRLDRGKRAAVLLGLAVPIALSPLWIPPQAPPVRLLAAISATAVLVKLYDLHVGAGQSSRPGFRAFIAFLPNWFSVVWRRLAAEPTPSTRRNLIHLGHALWKCAAAVGLVAWLFQRNWQGVPFVLEHCAKVLAVFLVLIPGSAFGVALWRLAGGQARDFMNAPLLAASPAQFWRRYNRPAQQFLYEDVFKRVGGFTSPVRAMLVTFIVSALVHEYVFGITLGRIQGYQTLFFLLQGLAVAANARRRPAKGRGVLWIGATLVFNLLTSMFFFASIHAVRPFYSRALPGWLAGLEW